MLAAATVAMSACTPMASGGPDRPALGKRVVRVAMPPTLDRLARVDRARDLQVTRGEALRDGAVVEVVPSEIGGAAHEVAEIDRLAAARASLAAGNRIDVVWTPFVDLGDLETAWGVAPLGRLAARDAIDLKAFMPQALQPAYSPTRGLLAMPSEIAVRQVYFRLDHLSEAGIDFRRAGLDFERPAITWETVRRVALDSRAAPAGRSRVAFDPLQESLPAAAWAWQAGAPVARLGPGSVGALREALAWLGSLAGELALGPGRTVPARQAAVRFGVSSKVPDASAIGADDAARHPLLAGNTTIAIDSTRLVSTIASHELDAPVRVVELPRRSSEARATGWSEVSGYALMPGAGDDAWDLLKYLTGEDASYASARAVAMRLPPVESPGPGARAPLDLPGGPRRWLPPYSARLALDRFLARQYRTGVTALDEAHDHGLEQVRHVGIIPFGAGTRTWLDAVERARRQVLREGRDPFEAASDAIARTRP